MQILAMVHNWLIGMEHESKTGEGLTGHVNVLSEMWNSLDTHVIAVPELQSSTSHQACEDE